ncbi:four helix bundle protein [Candidatus Amoebophilus asiaticus]|nr:four helix bundle protein [Candidatus Amoebophilus asiaticus]
MVNDLSERFLEFAFNIYKLSGRLNKTSSGRHVFGQLFRSSTSVGANYEEACAAESRADFIHKMQVVLKELRESFWWLRFIRKVQLIPEDDNILAFLLMENKELLNIIGKSVVTAKKGRR